MILTNERVNAETALRIGLVEEVVEKERHSKRPKAMAARGHARRNRSPPQVAHSPGFRNGVPRAAALSAERERFMDLFGIFRSGGGRQRISGETQTHLEKRLTIRRLAQAQKLWTTRCWSAFRQMREPAVRANQLNWHANSDQSGIVATPLANVI